MRCGRIRCLAGQGIVGMQRLPLCERQSQAGGGWPPWVSFLTSLPGRLRNPQPALDFLKSPKFWRERLWVLETKPPEGKEPDSQAPAPRAPAGE